MFVTIRGKLIALSAISLVFTVIVGGAGFWSQLELTRLAVQEQSQLVLVHANAQVNIGLEEIRSEVLQLMREEPTAETPQYKQLVASLDNSVKLLGTQVAKVANSSSLQDQTRRAAAALSSDSVKYAGSAREVTNMAAVNAANVDVLLLDFNENHKALKASQAALDRLLVEDAKAAHQNLENMARLSAVAILSAAGLAIAVLLISSILIINKISGSLNSFRRSVARVEASDYQERLNLKARDELGGLAWSFDKILEAYADTLKTSASENERLNNSVIGLFSAMGALSQKDLTVRAPITEDIIGTLGDAINQLTEVIATVLLHVTKVVGVVEAASERMKKQSDVVNEMAKEEDVIVVRLISNLETAMASIGEVAIFARDSNRAAAEATKSTESAMQTVQATLTGMDAIRETISEMEKRIKRLGERSQEISQIVNLINTISERTHVLSLNAAMQAAMAGEAGRGFAVVAEEVQRLAENSRQATAQIANLVQNIQVETNDTIATVNKTIEQVVNESELAHDAGERMRETHEATARLVRLVATIATSSAEQTKIASVLRSAADEIAQFTEKTAEQLVAQNQSATSLVSASQKLVEAISVFKLPELEPAPIDFSVRSEDDDGERTQIFDTLSR